MGYLRPHQVDEIANEKKVIEHTLTNQCDIQDRSNLQAALRRADQQIADHAPPDLTGEDRDRMTRECHEIEERLQPLMPSDEQMRRNTPGTVGQHNRFDKAAKEKTKQFPEGYLARWKDNQLALHKGDNDPDVANFERKRPMHNTGSMLGAQIEGQRYHGTNPSQAYLAGYDETFGNAAEKVDEPEPAPRERKPAVRKKKAGKRTRAPNKSAPKMTALACDKMMGPSGRHFHVAKCDVCKAAAKE